MVSRRRRCCCNAMQRNSTPAWQAPVIRGEGLHADNYNVFLQQLDAVKTSLDYFRCALSLSRSTSPNTIITSSPSSSSSSSSK